MATDFSTSEELTLVELHDIIESEREYKEGRGRFFRDAKAALAWLDSDKDADD